MKGVKVDMSEYEEFGKMRVKGRIHGWVEGVIDGEVDAVVLGRVHAAVISNNLFIDMQEQDIYAVEKAKEAYVTEMNEAEVTNKDMEEGGNDDEV